ncbi:MAG: HU family DNA-binding protein [Candidatus Muirbacterium halophilum]|nr:HU family DNA-binding protein [Candidatus Muirbacterium halophilum]MCK9476199.1 HU family DNA-binding protein [Candidatus Muirbacterium halophilum]
MNKMELIDAIAKNASISKKDAKSALEAMVEEITGTLKKADKVSLIGFGTFEIAERKARKGVNPRTGEEIKIKATRVPKFRPGKALKEAVK